MRRVIMKPCAGVLSAVLLIGCTMSPARRDVAATQFTDRSPNLSFTPIVQLGGEGERGLFIVQDKSTKTFSVAECQADPATQRLVLKAPAQCALIAEKWLPEGEQFENLFDETFNISVETMGKTVMVDRYGTLGSRVAIALLASTAAALPGGVVVGIVSKLVKAPRPGALGIVGGIVFGGVQMIVMLTSADTDERLEKKLLKRYPKLDRAEVIRVSQNLYEIARQASLAGLNATRAL